MPRRAVDDSRIAGRSFAAQSQGQSFEAELKQKSMTLGRPAVKKKKVHRISEANEDRQDFPPPPLPARVQSKKGNMQSKTDQVSGGTSQHDSPNPPPRSQSMRQPVLNDSNGLLPPRANESTNSKRENVKAVRQTPQRQESMKGITPQIASRRALLQASFTPTDQQENKGGFKPMEESTYSKHGNEQAARRPPQRQESMKGISSQIASRRALLQASFAPTDQQENKAGFKSMEEPTHGNEQAARRPPQRQESMKGITPQIASRGALLQASFTPTDQQENKAGYKPMENSEESTHENEQAARRPPQRNKSMKGISSQVASRRALLQASFAPTDQQENKGGFKYMEEPTHGNEQAARRPPQRKESMKGSAPPIASRGALLQASFTPTDQQENKGGFKPMENSEESTHENEQAARRPPQRNKSMKGISSQVASRRALLQAAFAPTDQQENKGAMGSLGNSRTQENEPPILRKSIKTRLSEIQGREADSISNVNERTVIEPRQRAHIEQSYSDTSHPSTHTTDWSDDDIPAKHTGGQNQRHNKKPIASKPTPPASKWQPMTASCLDTDVSTNFDHTTEPQSCGLSNGSRVPSSGHVTPIKETTSLESLEENDETDQYQSIDNINAQPTTPEPEGKQQSTAQRRNSNEPHNSQVLNKTRTISKTFKSRVFKPKTKQMTPEAANTSFCDAEVMNEYPTMTDGESLQREQTLSQSSIQEGRSQLLEQTYQVKQLAMSGGLGDQGDDLQELGGPTDLLTMISKYTHFLPMCVRVCRGFCSSICESFSQFDQLRLHFVKHCKVGVLIDEEDEEEYTVPVSSTLSFGLVYESDGIDVTELLRTIGDVMEMKPLPRAILATRQFKSGTPEKSVEANELLFVNKISKSLLLGKGKVLEVFTTDYKVKHLSAKCAGDFSVHPMDIQMTLSTMIEHSLQLPQRVVIIPDPTFRSYLPETMKDQPVLLESIRGETSVICTMKDGDCKPDEQHVMDVSSNLNIKVEIDPITENEEKELYDSTTLLYHTLNPSQLEFITEKSTRRSYDLQCLLYKRLIPGKEMDGVHFQLPRSCCLGVQPQIDQPHEAGKQMGPMSDTQSLMSNEGSFIASSTSDLNSLHQQHSGSTDLSTNEDEGLYEDVDTACVSLPSKEASRLKKIMKTNTAPTQSNLFQKLKSAVSKKKKAEGKIYEKKDYIYKEHHSDRTVQQQPHPLPQRTYEEKDDNEDFELPDHDYKPHVTGISSEEQPFQHPESVHSVESEECYEPVHETETGNEEGDYSDVRMMGMPLVQATLRGTDSSTDTEHSTITQSQYAQLNSKMNKLVSELNALKLQVQTLATTVESLVGITMKDTQQSESWNTPKLQAATIVKSPEASNTKLQGKSGQNDEIDRNKEFLAKLTCDQVNLFVIRYIMIVDKFQSFSIRLSAFNDIIQWQSF